MTETLDKSSGTSASSPSGPSALNSGWIGRARRFLSEVRNEMGRVSWPTRREVWATMIVVIITSAVFAVYLFLVDLGLSNGLGWVFRRFGA